MVVPRRECTATGTLSPPGIANPPTAHPAIRRPRRCSAAPLGVELGLTGQRSSRTANRHRVPPPLRDKWRWPCSASIDTGSWRNGARVVSRYAVETRASECHPFDSSRRRLSPDQRLQRAEHRPPDRHLPGIPDPRADHCVLPQAEHRALNTRAAGTMLAFDSERLLRMLDPGTACDPVTHHEQLRESSRLTVLRTRSAVAPSRRCFGLGGVGST